MGRARNDARSVNLSAAHVAQLTAAARVLLSPFTFETGAAWRLAACQAIEPLIGATHSISSIPLEGEDFWTGEPQVIDALAAHWPHPPCIIRAHVERRAALGLDVADWTEIFDVDEVRASDFYEALIRPQGLYAPLGMYTELAQLQPCALWSLQPRTPRQATLSLFSFFFRDEVRARRDIEWRKAILELLIPPLHTGIHAYVRARRLGPRLVELMDQIDAAIAVHRRGCVAHENAALTRLLQMDPEREAIRAAIRRAVYLADAQLERRHSKIHDDFLAKIEPNEIRTRRGRYAIYATVIEAGTYGWPDLTFVVVEQPGSGPATLHELAARYHLTAREAEALQLLREGASTRRIAATMRISVNTARRHIERLLTKLGVHSRVAAIAAMEGLGDPQ